MRPGLFIAFEGPEGSGKSTQARRLAGALAMDQIRVVQTREPGGTNISEQIRAVVLDQANISMTAMTEALLYAAARAQLVHDVIAPALQTGAVVICDRYADSSRAYQVGGRGLPEPEIFALQEMATGGIWPDLRILLDLNVSVGLARRFGEPEAVNRLDAADQAFHERVAAYYRTLAAADTAGWLILDGERPPDELASAILAAVRTCIARKPDLAIAGEGS